MSIVFLIILIYSCGNSIVEKYYYPNGKLETIITEKGENIYHFEGFYDDGKLKSIGNMVGTVANGIVTNYYKNGNVQTMSSYNMGKLNGLMKIYNPDGEINSQEYYLNDDLFYIQSFEKDKIVEERIFPILKQNKDKDDNYLFEVLVPFSDTLNYFNNFIDFSYKISKDSIWDGEKADGFFRFSKIQNKFEIKFDKKNSNNLYLQTYSTLKGSKITVAIATPIN
jgi:hypothetical protein